jgi:hypothetical protein
VLEPNRLISEEYKKTQLALHATGFYGTAGREYAPLVTQIINKMQVTHLLDYGCGSQLSLYKAITPNHKVTYQAYDPGTEDFAERPVPAQMVCCVDVLEHIEPDFLDGVLDDLASLTEVLLFASVDTGPAKKTLSDGRNAHLIQEPMEWWLPKIWARFDLHTFQIVNEHGFYVIAYAKPRFIEDEDGAKIAASTES